MKVIIMRGVPGSGKSTYIKSHFPNAYVVSADHFFEEPCADKGSVYKFDRSKLQEAHAACLRAFTVALYRDYFYEGAGTDEELVIVVDNTNIEAWEIAPYMALGGAFDAYPEIITLDVWADTAAERCIHGVPGNKIRDMRTRLLDGQCHFPYRWKNTVIRDEAMPGGAQ